MSNQFIKKYKSISNKKVRFIKSINSNDNSRTKIIKGFEINWAIIKRKNKRTGGNKINIKERNIRFETKNN